MNTRPPALPALLVNTAHPSNRKIASFHLPTSIHVLSSFTRRLTHRCHHPRRTCIYTCMRDGLTRPDAIRCAARPPHPLTAAQPRAAGIKTVSINRCGRRREATERERRQTGTRGAASMRMRALMGKLVEPCELIRKGTGAPEPTAPQGNRDRREGEVN